MSELYFAYMRIKEAQKLLQLERRVATLEQQVMHATPLPTKSWDVWKRTAGSISQKTAKAMLAHVQRSRNEWSKREQELTKLWKQRAS